MTLVREADPDRRWWRRLLWIAELALAVRIIGALGVEAFAERSDALGLFGDTAIYWELGLDIVRGEPYSVTQWGIPHQALRTPGYPLFLAGCQAAFGARTLPVRLVQAAIHAATVVALGCLAVRMGCRLGLDRPRSRTAALGAALVFGLEPYSVGASVVLLTEAFFIPVLVLCLWGQAWLWSAPDLPANSSTDPRADADPSTGSDPDPASVRNRELRQFGRWAIALGTGALTGLAILIRPSWILAPPLIWAAWIALAGRHRRVPALRMVFVMALMTVLVQAPWWIRNASVFDAFVPSALWSGASLYDGWNPEADGGSDLSFLNDEAYWWLPEVEQDRVLRHDALQFAASNPGRVLELAAIKFTRYWSPWPNLIGWPSWPALACSLWTVPIYAFALIGLWRGRRDPAVWVLLVAPVLYFCLIHLAFVSAIRYRVPGMIPIFVLVGWASEADWTQRLARRMVGRDPAPTSG